MTFTVVIIISEHQLAKLAVIIIVNKPADHDSLRHNISVGLKANSYADCFQLANIKGYLNFILIIF